MKNFDDHRAKRLNRAERTFQIGGEKFIAKASVRPEAIAEWDAMDPEKTPPAEIIRISDTTILALVEESGPVEVYGEDDVAAERWRNVRLREGDDALNTADIIELLKWLIGVQSGGRPTEQQSGSGQSPSGTGASSTVDSSSPVSLAEPTPST